MNMRGHFNHIKLSLQWDENMHKIVGVHAHYKPTMERVEAIEGLFQVLAVRDDVPQSPFPLFCQVFGNQKLAIPYSEYANTLLRAYSTANGPVMDLVQQAVRLKG